MIRGIKETPFSAKTHYPTKIEWYCEDSFNEVICYDFTDRRIVLDKLLDSQLTKKVIHKTNIRYVKTR